MIAKTAVAVTDQHGILGKRQIQNEAITNFLELEQQGRGEVERRVKEWEPIKEKGHVEVGLGGMQAHPRHTRRSRDRVGVIRLMHMPKKTDSNSFHGTERKLRTDQEYVIGIPTLQ